mmetsp:Transcript_38135/g.85139  ORF Transcript_38135/g.85139 Transcript_38135/m.85139 type:complete len:390 (-) Transcript_38135:72-1241(-)
MLHFSLSHRLQRPRVHSLRSRDVPRSQDRSRRLLPLESLRHWRNITDRFRRHHQAAKWLFLLEDDHSIDVKGLLRTLSYFNHSHPMTMGEQKFHTFHTGYQASPRGRKEAECLTKNYTYAIVPFRNPSLWTAAAIAPMVPGLLAGALRHQCDESGMTHDVVIGTLAWLYSLPHVFYWSSCVSINPWARIHPNHIASMKGPLLDCIREALGNNSANQNTSQPPERCILPSQVAIHGVKSAPLQVLTGRYMERFSAGRREIEACLRRGAVAAPKGGRNPPTERHFLRLVHQLGYARTAHAQQFPDGHVNPTTGHFRQFKMSDCQKGQDLGTPASEKTRSGFRWAGELALIDEYRTGERNEEGGRYDSVAAEKLLTSDMIARPNKAAPHHVL